MEFKNIHNFDPRTCISGKVMRLNRMTANIFRKHISPFGITDSQLSLLFILSKMEGLTQKQITDFLHLEKSSLNRNLKRLLDKELLTRKDFPLIKITNKGKELTNRIIPHWERAMAEIRVLLGEEGEIALNVVASKLKAKIN